MRPLWIVMLVLLPTLAGCTEPRRVCTDGYPLVIQAHPDVTNASLVRGATYLYNCTDAPMALEHECLPLFELYPRMVVDNVTYVVGLDASAIPVEDAPCTGVPQERSELAPGHTMDLNGYRWDGSIRPPDAEAPVTLSGNHTWRVLVAGLVEEVVVEAPSR